jgi:pyruvate kinase
MTKDKYFPPIDIDLKKACELSENLEKILRGILEFESGFTARVSKIHRAYETSARNLIHYVALQRYDLFPLRKILSELGLSSLGRNESHIIAGIMSVLNILNHILRRQSALKAPYERQVTYEQGYSLLETHTEALFGPTPHERRVRIMVTLSSEAASDYDIVRKLIENGMDCARINCAHDDKFVWEKMCINVGKAEREIGRRCRILMDLSGPKLRTGSISRGNQVLKVKPARNELGVVIKSASVWLTDNDDHYCPAGSVRLPVMDGWHRSLKIGDSIVYRDARNKLRRMLVVEKIETGCRAETDKTGYFIPSTVLRKIRNNKTAGKAGKPGDIPYSEEFLLLRIGDRLKITTPDRLGSQERRSASGKVISPASIPCTLPEIFNDVKPGERICLDDGKITGIIESVARKEIVVRIISASLRGSKLRSDKGINLPDSNLSISGLTVKDVADLEFIAAHADIVALSFVRSPSDISFLHEKMRCLGGSNIGIVLKIETLQAVKRLPSLLLSAMSSHPAGIMIARGDLAVELGFDNLAEAQDEILLTCEAAHVPVIWATQVLENLAKSGLPSRAEISDAAMGVRAECVMLNKGEFICEAVTMLDKILKRMEHRSLNKIDYRRKCGEDRHFIEGFNDEES